MVTRTSDDAVGQCCINKLHQYDIDTTYVTPEGGEARNSFALYDSALRVIYRNGAADFEMTTTSVEAVDYSAFVRLSSQAPFCR